MLSVRPVSLVLAFALFAAFTAGCASKPHVSYGDAEAVETLTIDFGSTDLQLIAEKMIESLVAHPAVAQGNRPVVSVSTFRNKTSEHIDCEAITNTIRTKLLRSGKVQFTAVTEANKELVEQLEYQNGEMIDPATAQPKGKQVGADYLLQGVITSIGKKAGRDQDLYYKVTMNLINIKTGLIEWAEEKEIRKGSHKSLFG